MNRKLFRRAGRSRVRLDELLRGDSKAQAEAFRAALGGPGTGDGWMSVNEVRRRRRTCRRWAAASTTSLSARRSAAPRSSSNTREGADRMKMNKLLQLLRDNARNARRGSRRIRAESTDTEAHVYVYDVIDKWWGASASGAGRGAGRRRRSHRAPAHQQPGRRRLRGARDGRRDRRASGQVVAHIDGCRGQRGDVSRAGRPARCDDRGRPLHDPQQLDAGHGRQDRAALDRGPAREDRRQIARRLRAPTGASADQVAPGWTPRPGSRRRGARREVHRRDRRRTRSAMPTRLGAGARARWNLSAYANAPKLEPPEPTTPPHRRVTRSCKRTGPACASLHIS
jgi:hypothetical protein